MEIELPEAYEIDQEIGSGGGGTVFLAWHKNLQKKVVIKQLHSEYTDEVVQRKEVDILKNLHHQFLPQVFDFFISDGIAYTVMDYVEGKSLNQLLIEGRKFTEKEVISIGEELTSALNYMHSRKPPIIHGDIKPDNIMYTPEGHICLIDFNISGIANEGTAYTFGYTPGYAAPEEYEAFKKIQKKREEEEKAFKSADNTDETMVLPADYYELLFQGKIKAENCSSYKLEEGIPIDKRSDVYSCGATLYRLYTGTVYSPDNAELLKANTSEGFLYLLNRSLKESPKERFKDAGEMYKTITNLHKMNREYRIKMMLRLCGAVALIVATAIGILMFQEKKRLNEEMDDNRYTGYLEEMRASFEKNDETAFEEQYNLAIDLFPDRLEAYMEKANYLYGKGLYKEDIDYIENKITLIESMNWQEAYPFIILVLADCYFETGDYKEAVIYYEKVINSAPDMSEANIGAAISYARNGNTKRAEEILNNGIQRGLKEESMYLIKGEIAFAEKKYTEAEEYLKQAINASEDDYTRFRAYLVCARSISAQKKVDDSDKVLADKCIDTLKEAINTLPKEYHTMLLYQLASEYAYKYMTFDDMDAAASAADIYETIRESGVGDMVLYSNLVTVYDYLGEYEKEEKVLSEMDSLFPNNYKVKIYYALMECGKQSMKEEADRSYSAFIGYYDQAKELIMKLDSSRRGDPEIKLLESAYKQLKEGNWLDK